MSQIKKKFISANAVDETKIRLSNNANLRARNAADDGDVSVLKVNASNRVEFASVPQAGSDASDGNDLVRKSQFDTSLGLKLDASEKGSPSGVCPLNASSKIDTTYLPASIVGAVNYKGVKDASGGSYPADPLQGDYYVISVAGTMGGHAYAVSDICIFNGSTWDFIDNSTFTAAQAKSACVADGITDGITDVAPSQNAVFDALAGKIGTGAVDGTTVKLNGSSNLESLKAMTEVLTLSSDDITAQFKDLGHVIHSATGVSLTPDGGLMQLLGTDFTVSLTGGVDGVTRITLAGDLATAGAAALVAGDKITVCYDYLT